MSKVTCWDPIRRPAIHLEVGATPVSLSSDGNAVTSAICPHGRRRGSRCRRGSRRPPGLCNASVTSTFPVLTPNARFFHHNPSSLPVADKQLPLVPRLGHCVPGRAAISPCLMGPRTMKGPPRLGDNLDSTEESLVTSAV